LNYGHTVGHALEALTNYNHYTHGEAIAIGMIAAARIAHEISATDQNTVQIQERLISAAGKGQGGLFRGTEATSLEALTQAARDGFDYVDVELNTKDAHTKVHQLKQHGAKVIVSYHNTKLTPTDQALESILENEARAGADVCKIVSTARTYADNLRIKESNRIEAMTEGLKEMNIQTMESEDTFTIHGGRRAKRSSIHTTITG
jgi:3-dehydroquinate dehydratase type I